MTRVTIAGLSKRYGGLPAVDGVSIELADGEFLSLLGPSGCGKTTTLKMVAGFEVADAGSIAFDRRDVSHLPPERRDIGMVFQSYALFPHMTVAGNLAFGLEMRALPKAEIAARVARVLDMVQLAGMQDRYPRQLSGGQQQRVALARALVIEPSILLLDEPLANLDAKLRDEMRVFIRDLQQRVGITTIYVTHDQAEAMTMSDRIAVMFQGRVAQLGSAEDVYERPASAAVAGFVGNANLLAATVDKGQASCALGTLPAGGAAADATDALVVVRPEAVRLDTAGAANARIESAYYAGSVTDYRVRLASGERLQVQATGPGRFRAGEAVAARFAGDRFWTVRPT